MPGKVKRTTTVKKAAAAAAEVVKTVDYLHPSTPRSFRVGGDIRPKMDLGRYVRWPRSIRLQRQRKVLLKRLKVPPSINQFTNTLDKNHATELFKLLNNYRPETRAQKKQRLHEKAKAKALGKAADTSAVNVVKFGLNHVTQLVEEKKASLVVIAHDVDPIELVVWLPALCRKMEVPYCIVKGKSRLGALVHQKNATCVALTTVAEADSAKLGQLCEAFKAQFNNNFAQLRKWGGGIMGARTQARIAAHQKALAQEKEKKEKAAAAAAK